MTVRYILSRREAALCVLLTGIGGSPAGASTPSHDYYRGIDAVSIQAKVDNWEANPNIPSILSRREIEPMAIAAFKNLLGVYKEDRFAVDGPHKNRYESNSVLYLTVVISLNSPARITDPSVELAQLGLIGLGAMTFHADRMSWPSGPPPAFETHVRAFPIIQNVSALKARLDRDLQQMLNSVVGALVSGNPR